MAKNIGLIQFKGSLGDLVGYKRNGVFVVQRKGGFNGSRLKTEERYASVRKRQSEFGRCAKISSAMKHALSEWLQWVPEKMIYNHLQSMVMAVKNCDVVSEKGAKTFGEGLKTAAGGTLLKRFSFNKKYSMGIAVIDSFDFEKGTVSIMPTAYKLPQRTMLCVQLLVLQLDLDAYEWSVRSSEVHYTNELGVAVDLHVALPEGDGCKMALLFIGKCTPDGTNLLWLHDAEVGLRVLDFCL